MAFLNHHGVEHLISKIADRFASAGGAAYDEIHHGSANNSWTLTPNTLHVWDEVEELNISLGEQIEGIANEYLFQFTSGSEPTSLILPADIKWANGEAPVIEPHMIYQISILKGLASVLEFSNEAPSVPIVFYVNDNPYDAMSNMTWIDFINSDYNPDIYNDKMFIEGGYGNPKYAGAIYSEDDIEYYTIYTEGYGEVLLTDKILSITYMTE